MGLWPQKVSGSYITWPQALGRFPWSTSHGCCSRDRAACLLFDGARWGTPPGRHHIHPQTPDCSLREEETPGRRPAHRLQLLGLGQPMHVAISRSGGNHIRAIPWVFLPRCMGFLCLGAWGLLFSTPGREGPGILALHQS